MAKKERVKVYFSDYFQIPSKILAECGAFDVSLINDLPLFIDPFLLFNSEKPEYKKLHESIITYLLFLRKASLDGQVDRGLLKAWFRFSEVKQNWLGFSVVGNKGSGLGLDFAHALNNNLYKIFIDFGKEKITHSSHLEKLCLIGPGVGKDNISDFTTNLIKEYLLEYTQQFTLKYLQKSQRRRIRVRKVKFNYKTRTWEPKSYILPYIFNDYVILTPKDMLTKDEIWINKADMLRDYQDVIEAIDNDQLRAQLNRYLFQRLSELPEKAKKSEKDAAVLSVFQEHPELLDYYIRYKEDSGEEAVNLSELQVEESEFFYVDQVREFVLNLFRTTGFYTVPGATYREARKRVLFLKDVIENKGGHKIFYDREGEPVRRESDLHILFRLTWYATPSDISREVNDGRGPVDFKASRGAYDKTLLEFKLASNPQLENNLKNQVEIYKKASDAERSIKVIFYFNVRDFNRVQRILDDLRLTENKDIILVDARSDNKPSGSHAR